MLSFRNFAQYSSKEWIHHQYPNNELTNKRGRSPRAVFPKSSYPKVCEFLLFEGMLGITRAP